MDVDMVPGGPHDLGARLLRLEHDALLPILRRTPAEAFDRPTGCIPSPRAERARRRRTPLLPLEAVLAELERGYRAAGPALTAAEGELDGLALGEWIHGGDVREALGEPASYESDGVQDALALLVERC